MAVISLLLVGVAITILALQNEQNGEKNIIQFLTGYCILCNSLCNITHSYARHCSVRSTAKFDATPGVRSIPFKKDRLLVVRRRRINKSCFTFSVKGKFVVYLFSPQVPGKFYHWHDAYIIHTPVATVLRTGHRRIENSGE